MDIPTFLATTKCMLEQVCGHIRINFAEKYSIINTKCFGFSDNKVKFHFGDYEIKGKSVHAESTSKNYDLYIDIRFKCKKLQVKTRKYLPKKLVVVRITIRSFDDHKYKLVTRRVYVYQYDMSADAPNMTSFDLYRPLRALKDLKDAVKYDFNA